MKKEDFNGCQNCRFHYIAAGYDWCKLLDVGQPCPWRQELANEEEQDNVRESKDNDCSDSD